MRSKKNLYIVQIAIFGVIAAIVMFFSLPLFFVPGFYKLDLSKLIVLTGAFLFGPLAGILIELIKIILILIFKGTSTFFIGELASFVIGCSFLLPCSIYYKHDKTLKGAIHSMLIGILSFVSFSGIINWVLFIPLYAKAFGISIQNIIDIAHVTNPYIVNLPSFIFFAVMPFNFIEITISCFLTFLLYKKISKIVKKLNWK